MQQQPQGQQSFEETIPAVQFLKINDLKLIYIKISIYLKNKDQRIYQTI